MAPQRILLTGATGYVGSRLLLKLKDTPHSLRCLAREPKNLGQLEPKIEIVPGNVLDFESVKNALTGIDVAYYLVHSMGEQSGFSELEIKGAHHFAKAAEICGVKKIIYLGGLGDDRLTLSPHLKSRHEVGNIFRTYATPVVEFRASIILGSGSVSFELIRALVERLPIMTVPSWVSNRGQPIGIWDVIDYLYQALDKPLPGNPIFEIGGPKTASYLELMKEYAEQRKLKRIFIPLPFLTPRLSSLWLGLVTPVYARIGRKLIESIRCNTVVVNPVPKDLFAVTPMTFSQAIEKTIIEEDIDLPAQRWCDSMSSTTQVKSWAGVKLGSRLIDSREKWTYATTESVFRVIEQLGGDSGWHHANFLWKVRGWIDLLVGGIGLRRGRKNPHHLKVGDVVDWWRVEEIKPGTLIRFFAEMKLPGRAWLEFEVVPSRSGSLLKQTAVFEPKGLFGLLYWYSIYPLHEWVFTGMIRKIIHRVEGLEPLRNSH